jgi:hypothetical protein
LNEGLAKQNYREMNTSLMAMAKKDGVSLRITMDQTSVYIQMQQGSYYLYQIIPLTLHQGGVAS